MAKFLQFTETEEQIIVKRAVYIISKAVTGCDTAVRDLEKLSNQSGGKDEFLAKLGDSSAGVVSSYISLKNLIESISDLSIDSL